MNNNNNSCSNNSINNMDDSSSLGFSLSNKNNYFQTSTSSADSSHLSLFEAFTTASERVRGGEEEAAGISSATDLSIFTAVGSPKLEDFLGGSSTTAAPPQQQQQQQQIDHHHHFSTASTTAATPSEIYDFELKTIASSFFRGFATEQVADTKHLQQQQHQQQRIVPLVAAERSPKRSVETFGQRTSVYRGVTRHRWTGRYEAHLWDNTSRREGQSRKGRQVYLGGYDKEEKAARAYDLAALKYWGPTTATNFPVVNYGKELEEMKNMTRQEFVASLRRKSSGFSRGASIYRGVTRHHQHGRWQARIGRVAGNKDLYLGTFSTQEEAAEAYDIAAIKFRGLNAVTNFDMSRYDVKSIASSNLPIGGITGGNKSKNSSEAASDCKSPSDDRDVSSASSHLLAVAYASSHPFASTPSFALLPKQDPSSVGLYSPNLVFGHQNNTTATSLTTNNAKNNLSIAPAHPSYFQIPNSLDFGGNSSTVNENNNGLFNDGNYLQMLQQQSCDVSNIMGSNTTTTTSATTRSSNNNIPFATPSGLNSSNNYESGWLSPSLHSFQTAKQGLPVFQTPIFGIE